MGVHGKNTKVYANGYDLTGFFRQSSSEAIRDVAESTVYGLDDKTYLAGLRDATLSLEGLFDGDADAVDEVLDAALGQQSSLWTIWPRGDQNGNEGSGYDADETNYSVDSPVDDVVGVSAEAQSRVGRERVISHHALGAEAASGSGPAIDGGAASANGGVGYLQVPAFAGWDSVDVVIEDSADGSTGWATILTFTNITAARAKERVAISGTVRRWTRVTWTFNGVGPGSATFNVAFGRK